jgi:hypothetical protein
MVRNRLESFQFMGSANGGVDFLEGLRSLALLYPLVLAAARYSCVSRGAGELASSDVDYAVTAIEHSFGRQPMLHTRPMRSLQRRLVQPSTFARLVQGI